MTNDTIMQAAIMLDNGWCVAELLEPADVGADKHCAVGAVAAVTNTMVFFERDRYDTRGPVVNEDATYEKFNALPEGKILAQEVIDSPWLAGQPDDVKEALTTAFEDEEFAQVVFTFNDSQDEKSDVIKMFKRASRR